MNLGVKELHFDFDQDELTGMFVYTVSFCFNFTGRRYKTRGWEPTPDQAFSAAMMFVAATVREAVEA